MKNVLIYTIFLCLFLNVLSFKDNCIVKYSFKKVCHFYRSSDDCNRQTLKNCQKIRTTYNEFRCPIYICKKVSYHFLSCNGFVYRLTCCSCLSGRVFIDGARCSLPCFQFNSIQHVL